MGENGHEKRTVPNLSSNRSAVIKQKGKEPTEIAVRIESFPVLRFGVDLNTLLISQTSYLYCR
jgi:hypothetical protein